MADDGRSGAGSPRATVVLLVDDDQTIRRVGERMLQRMGFAVELAVDGVDATERFERESGRYGCVLLDLVMPRMDGIETMSELRRICPDVRVVLSSGYSEDEIRERFAERGFAGFIQKPYRYAQLERVLGHAMRG